MGKLINIIEKLGTINPSGARSGRVLQPFRGVTWHETGNTSIGANALAHANLILDGYKDKQISWHYCVDENSAYRSIPENEVAWHAGDGTKANGGNMATIAIEACINSDGNFLIAKDSLCRLTAEILYRHGFTRAIANENIFQHNYWSGKNCPANIRATAGEFEQLIGVTQAYLSQLNIQAPLYESSEADPMLSANPKEITVGSMLLFKGGYVYKNSQAASAVTTATPGNAKVTLTVLGAKHPYHVIHTDNTSKVYGWVDQSTVDVSAIESIQTDSVPVTVDFKPDDRVKIKREAGKYSRSVADIPEKHKNNPYTIQQVSNDDVLIQELYSWVKKTDVERA